MQIKSLPILKSETGKEKVKTVGVPALLTAGAALIASKAPKGSADTVKFTKRLGKATKAGLIAAAVMAILTTKKEELGQVGAKAKSGLTNLKNKFVKPKNNEAIIQNQPNINNQATNEMQKSLDNALTQAEIFSMKTNGKQDQFSVLNSTQG